jgi:hypothetical protein
MAEVQNYCAYCNVSNPGTVEHIIPRGWFPAGKLIKIPLVVSACSKCNVNKSKDDEWVRKWFSTLISDQSPEALDILYSKVARSIKRTPVLGQEMLNKMTLVDIIHEPTGLWLGRKTKIEIEEDDWKRIFGWVDLVARGLWVRDKNQSFPDEFGIKSFYACDEWLRPKEFLKPILPSIPYPSSWHLEDASVFTFGRSYIVEDQQTSVWITGFYNRILFLTFVGHKDWIESQRQVAGKQNEKKLN